MSLQTQQMLNELISLIKNSYHSSSIFNIPTAFSFNWLFFFVIVIIINAMKLKSKCYKYYRSDLKEKKKNNLTSGKLELTYIFEEVSKYFNFFKSSSESYYFRLGSFFKLILFNVNNIFLLAFHKFYPILFISCFFQVQIFNFTLLIVIFSCETVS